MKRDYDLSKAKRGAVASSKGKTRITIYIDDDVLAAYRKKGDEFGRGYQTLINEALHETIGRNRAVDAATIRRIVREELKRVV